MVAKGLLHADNKHSKQSGTADDARQCELFFEYSVYKIEVLLRSIHVNYLALHLIS
jgi:hypothetical protein